MNVGEYEDEVEEKDKGCKRRRKDEEIELN